MIIMFFIFKLLFSDLLVLENFVSEGHSEAIFQLYVKSEFTVITS